MTGTIFVCAAFAMFALVLVPQLRALINPLYVLIWTVMAFVSLMVGVFCWLLLVG